MSLVGKSSSAKPPATTLAVIEVDPNDLLQKIARVFQINLDAAASREEQQEFCFQKVLEACRQGAWEQIHACENEISQLTDRLGRSFLFYCIQTGDPKLSKELITRKIGIHFRDSEDNTALHAAAQAGDLDTISILYKHILIDAKNRQGETPLHIAIGAGQNKVIVALLANGANKETLCQYKTLQVSPLAYAVICGQLECLEELLKHTSISTVSTALGNAFHLAVNFHQNEVLRHICQKHPEEAKNLLEQKDSHGRTPFALCVTFDNREALYILKALGANPETQDYKGRRPIHEATLRSNLFMIECLYHFNCQIDPPDLEQKRPIDLITGSDSDALSTRGLLTNLAQRTQHFDNMPPQYNYLPPLAIVYKGGGPKGLAYVGALQVLERKGALRHLLRVGGTSAGAINAALLALNYSYNDMLELLGNTNLASFLDHPSAEKALMTVSLVDYFKKNPSISSAFEVLKQLFLKKINPLVMVTNLFHAIKNHAGICEGETFRCWIDTQFEKKTKIPLCTFKEYRNLIEQDNSFKHLHVFATQLGPPSKVFHFSSEDPQCDDFIISDAVTASMTIPVAYKPHIIHKKINDQRVPCPKLGSFVDGGLVCNLPVEEFDRKKYIFQGLPREEQDCPMFNKRTLGFSLYSLEEKQIPDPQKITSVGQLLKCIVALIGDAQEQLRKMNSYHQHRVIEIDNQGVGLLEFNLTDEKKKKLLLSGEKATEQFFERQGGEVEENSLFYLPRVLKEIKRAISVKPPHPHLVRRKALLQEIEKILFSKIPITHVLYGPGGVGKSELAIAFANDHLDDFSLVWSISCGSAEEMSLSYRTLASTLKVYIDEKDSIELILQKVHIRLAQNTGKPWLLIFDNLNHPSPLPERGGVVLITAYGKKPDTSATEVPPFSPGEALELLETATKKKSPLYQRLIELSGCYPLLLGQIASYLARTSISVEEYITLLEKSVNPIQSSERYPKTLETALRLTIKELPPLALKWLQMCSYLNAAVIPVSYLEAWLAKANPQDKATLILQRQAIVIVLHEHALLRHDPETKSFSLHLDVQKTLRLIFAQEPLIDVIKLLVLLAEEWAFETTKEWVKDMKKATIWASHAEALLKMTDRIEDQDKAVILSKMGNWEYKQGRIKKSLQYHEKTLVIRKATFGDNHPDVATSLTHIGRCYYSHGDYAQALRMYNQALAIWKAALGDNHLYLATSLNNIGLCYHSHGDYAQALRMYNQTLAIWKAVLGDYDPVVATNLNNIGYCYFSQGNYAEALQMHNQALVIRKATLGDNHPDVATSLNHIGLCYSSQGNYAQALQMHNQALVIRKATLGDNHPYVATNLNNIGYCYFSQGNYAEALQMHNQALVIRKATLGDNHPYVATSLNNIGNCYYSQGNYAEALQMHNQALVIRKATLGDNHPDVATSLNHIGLCYSSQGNYAQALQMHNQALVIRKATLGDNHPYVATSLNNIGSCYSSQGNYAQALQMHNQALAIKKATLGDNHPDVATSLNNIGNCYYSQGNYAEALQMHNQALVIRKATLGDNHPDVKLSLDNIRQCKEKQKSCAIQ